MASSCETQKEDMIYDFKSAPPWYVAMLLGFQHFLTMCFPNAVGSLVVANSLCLADDSPEKATLISASFFAMGFTTFLQTTFGTRLPIIQGATLALLLPTMSMLKMPNLANCNASQNVYMNKWFDNATRPLSVFHMKMQMISGCFMVASAVEITIAVSGILKLLAKLMTPLSLSSIYCVLSLSFVENLFQLMEKNWVISLSSTAVMIFMIVVMSPLPIPFWIWSKNKGWKKIHLHVFRVSPILISIGIMWMVCYIMTATNTFPDDPTHWGYDARTDLKLRSIYETPIFTLPSPGRWSPPLIYSSGIVGMSIGIIISIIESLGDYMATARICKAPKIPSYAINRGILMEGIGVFLSGLFGSSVGPTSYSDNIGLFQATKAGNRIITQYAAMFMLLCGIFPIFGAVCVSIPTPVIGGVSIIMTFMILGVGIGYLHKVNLYSVRNILTFSTAVGFGLYLPLWVRQKGIVINTGSSVCDEVILILLTQGLFIVALVSIVMDNVLPGNYERTKKFAAEETETVEDNEKLYMNYDLPVIRWIALRYRWAAYLPLCPSYSRSDKTKLPINENEVTKL